jgi:WG repeat protein
VRLPRRALRRGLARRHCRGAASVRLGGRVRDGRAAVRLGGLYGFVAEDGREIVKPQYRIVGNYKHGFAQVDVDGKSGLIDRDGKMVFEPKYGFIEAIAADRFRVSDTPWISGSKGGEAFGEESFVEFGRKSFVAPGATREMFPLEPSGQKAVGRSPIVASHPPAPPFKTRIMDGAGQVIEVETPPATSLFDKKDPSVRWVQKDKLWGLQRTDGTWLVEPKFEQVRALSGGVAHVTLNGKVGFIDRTGKFVIDPVFEKAWPFLPGFEHTSAARDGVFGVIDRGGAWVFKTEYEQVHYAPTSYGIDAKWPTVIGWHFTKAGRWGLLDLDGRVVLDAEFDQPVSICADGRRIARKGGQELNFRADGSRLDPPNGRLHSYSCLDRQAYQLQIGDKVGLVAADGATPLTPVHFDALAPVDGPFPDESGLWNAKVSGKWGRIALDGGWVIDPKFDYLSRQRDLVVAAVDGKRGFMHADGTWLIEPRFDAVALLGDAGTAIVTVSGATGVLRLEDQSWVIPPRPGVMCGIRHAIMWQGEGKRVILSPAGETWIDIGAERVGINLDLGLLTFLKNGKWGLVDTAGKVIVEPEYDAPVYFVPNLRGVAWAKRGERSCAIDRRGRPVPSLACTDTDPMPGLAFQCRVEQ